jgi:hypothetical protein
MTPISGRDKATAIKTAIESSTKLKASVDKLDKQEMPDFIYLLVE